MVELFTLTAPLLVRYPDGEQRLVAEKFTHPQGMVYTEPFWLESELPAAYLLKGEIKGDGPWKVGEVVVRLLNCGDTDQSMQWAQWQQYLLSCPEQHTYHDVKLKQSIINNMSFPD